MTVVVDASALIDALLIDGPARARLSRASLHAPELIDAEVLSVLRRHPVRDLCKRAWQLRANLSAYDALYAALAERIAAPLLTADARLARAPGMGCSVVLLEA